MIFGRDNAKGNDVNDDKDSDDSNDTNDDDGTNDEDDRGDGNDDDSDDGDGISRHHDGNIFVYFRKRSAQHPEVVDVHRQQQENSLASIHLPRDVSADMTRAADSAADSRRASDASHRSSSPRASGSGRSASFLSVFGGGETPDSRCNPR